MSWDMTLGERMGRPAATSRTAAVRPRPLSLAGRSRPPAMPDDVEALRYRLRPPHIRRHARDLIARRRPKRCQHLTSAFVALHRNETGVSMVLNRLLVAVTSTLVLAITYVVGVLAVAAAFGVPGGSLRGRCWSPAALVGVCFACLPAPAGHGARDVYGMRGDSLAVLHTLSQHLAQALPEVVPDRIVEGCSSPEGHIGDRGLESR